VRGQCSERRLTLNLILTFLFVLTVLVAGGRRRTERVAVIRESQSRLGVTVDRRLLEIENQDDIAGFRLLVTILAGVALGAAASALPTLMSTPVRGELFVAVWLFWATGVVAVILVYLSTLTGSKVIPNEIDILHTAALIASFLAQCGLFASLIRVNVYESVHWWLISFSSFGAAATVAILLALRILPKSRRVMDSKVLAIYRRGQWSDAVMASITVALPVAYLLFVPEPSDRSILIASLIALISMIAACVKQSLERRRLRRDGLI
jgi:hypothetical protein